MHLYYTLPLICLSLIGFVFIFVFIYLFLFFLGFISFIFFFSLAECILILYNKLCPQYSLLSFLLGGGGGGED